MIAYFPRSDNAPREPAEDRRTKVAGDDPPKKAKAQK
jgi:hypothetical protein